MDGLQKKTSPSGRRRLPCLLCPLTLLSRRLLDVHVRSHRASGGFSCVRCGWTVESWEELEPHWRSCCSWKEQKEKKKKKKKKKRRKKEEETTASRNIPRQTHAGCDRRRNSRQSGQNPLGYTTPSGNGSTDNQ